jgi:4-hydroxybenzoate polyprenyltransferase
MSKTAKRTAFIVLSVIFFIIGLSMNEAGFLLGIPIAAVAIMILYTVIFKKQKKGSTEIKLNKEEDKDIILKK